MSHVVTLSVHEIARRLRINHLGHLQNHLIGILFVFSLHEPIREPINPCIAYNPLGLVFSATLMSWSVRAGPLILYTLLGRNIKNTMISQPNKFFQKSLVFLWVKKYQKLRIRITVLFGQKMLVFVGFKNAVWRVQSSESQQKQQEKPSDLSWVEGRHFASYEVQTEPYSRTESSWGLNPNLFWGVGMLIQDRKKNHCRYQCQYDYCFFVFSIHQFSWVNCMVRSTCCIRLHDVFLDSCGVFFSRKSKGFPNDRMDWMSRNIHVVDLVSSTIYCMIFPEGRLLHQNPEEHHFNTKSTQGCFRYALDHNEFTGVFAIPKEIAPQISWLCTTQWKTKAGRSKEARSWSATDPLQTCSTWCIRDRGGDEEKLDWSLSKKDGGGGYLEAPLQRRSLGAQAQGPAKNQS